MCGIAGVLGRRGTRILAEKVEGMVRMLHHRGPDELGLMMDGPLGFGHARLSIIDLANGQQPMGTQDDRFWITYNGEIFNYVELRAELTAKGHHFVTDCDTEVLLHLYQEYGPECVHKLNGQWSFAIWDKTSRSL